MNITVTVNGSPRTSEVEPRMLLVHYIREVLGLRGAHVGCDTTSCGVCTVLLDGLPVKSCTMFAVQADGRTSFTRCRPRSTRSTGSSAGSAPRG